jgi:hypothetical protein
MFSWFDKEARLAKRYARMTAEAERSLNRDGDRAKHADLLAAAEEVGKELDAVRASKASG